LTAAAPLLDLPQAPVPTGGAAEWFTGQGGARLRAALFASKEPAKVRGSVVLSPGRTEAIEKYFEVVSDLQARGFVVLVHDWRGQGLSHRMLPDRLKGHAEGMTPFLDDYQALLSTFESRLPKPWIAMGHSMGGCLTAIALGHGERRFSAAILSAPMFGLNTGGRPKAVTRLLAQAMVLIGKGGDYVLGDPGKPFTYDFANNALTHDQSRFDRAFAQITACPDLALGSPTWSWLKFAFQACDWLAKDRAVTRINIPIIVLGAGAEALVDNTEQAAITARMPKGRHQMVEGAFHEILMETDALRAPFWQSFDRLAAEVAP
jgi:lysophospholipase